MAKADFSLSEARRIALAAQGFDKSRPRGRITKRNIRSVITQLGLIQIDFVNVTIPAHYQVPFSRLGPYNTTLLDDLVYRSHDFTEQWAHEASIIPMNLWPVLRHRMRPRRWSNRVQVLLDENEDYVRKCMKYVKKHGPVSIPDIPESTKMNRRLTDNSGWGIDMRKIILETYFYDGKVAVTDRLPNFSRVYDVSERVIPTKHFKKKINREDAQRELLRRAARSHGIATAADLADYYRMKIPQARPRLKELVEEGELEAVKVEGWKESAFLHADAKRPQKINACSLLSPFDPLIWFRPRTERLFDFHYRIEIYVPKAKRRWGYYVFPFLMGDQIVARVDLKSDRANRQLLVLATHLENGVKKSKSEVAKSLAKEMQQFATWLNLDSIKVARKGNFASLLSSAVLKV